MKLKYGWLPAVLFECVLLSGFAAEPADKRSHPYLFCTPANIAAVKLKVQQDPAFAQAWQKMLADADRFTEDQRAGLNRAEVLGLAYRMTGEDKYAQAVRRILLNECRREAWGERMLLNRTPPWNAGLNEARNCYDMAVGFDSVYDALSGQDRRTIASGLVRLGILPTLNDWLIGPERIHSLDTMGHNWWSGCVFMAGIASMAVMNEEPRAAQWLEKISEGSLEWFDFAGSSLQNKPRNFDRAGGFYESVNYAAFGMSEYLLFRVAWQNAMDTSPPQVPILEKTGEFFLHACYPNSGPLMSVNFGDGSLHAHGARPVQLLMAAGCRTDNFPWYLAQVQQGQFREGGDISTPTGMLFFPSAQKNAEAQCGLPESMLYEDMGWAMMRSSWQKDATLLAVKSGFTWNHAHADAGSFILFHKGQNLLIDSGNCSYSLPEYTQYYCQSAAHNVVLFDGRGQNPEDDYYGVKNPGLLDHLMDTGTFKYVYADATGPYAQNFSRNYRHFLWIDDVVLVIDDLKTHTPGRFEWLLHYADKAQRKGLDLHVTKEQARVRVRPLFPETFPDGGLPHDFPEKMQLAERMGLKDHDQKTQVPYAAFAAPEITRRMKFVTAIFLDPDTNTETPTAVERLEGKDMIGVRIRSAGGITDVYFNLAADGRIKHRNSHNMLNGWETDALIAAVTYDADRQDTPKSLKRFFVAHGSYLRKEGITVLDSLSKVFLLSEKSADGLNVLLEGQPRMNVGLYSGYQPQNVILNNFPIQPKYESRTGQITLPTVQSR